MEEGSVTERIGGTLAVIGGTWVSTTGETRANTCERVQRRQRLNSTVTHVLFDLLSTVQTVERFPAIEAGFLNAA